MRFCFATNERPDDRPADGKILRRLKLCYTAASGVRGLVCRDIQMKPPKGVRRS